MVPNGLECEGRGSGEPANVVVDGLRMVSYFSGLGREEQEP